MKLLRSMHVPLVKFRFRENHPKSSGLVPEPVIVKWKGDIMAKKYLLLMQGVFSWLDAVLSNLLNVYLRCCDQSEPCSWAIIQLDRVSDLACLSHVTPVKSGRFL